jgi:hypothetical protein
MRNLIVMNRAESESEERERRAESGALSALRSRSFTLKKKSRTCGTLTFMIKQINNPFHPFQVRHAHGLQLLLF